MAQRVLVIGMRELFEYMWVLGRSMDIGLAGKVVLCKVLLEMRHIDVFCIFRCGV